MVFIPHPGPAVFKIGAIVIETGEMKGIIARCELFVGSRMHANIAALSSKIPTIAIAYSHKTPGIMAMLDQQEAVVDIENVTNDELFEKIINAWKEKRERAEKLETVVRKLEESALTNIEMIGSIVGS